MKILRGFLSEATNSSNECAPKNFFPLARPLMKASTFETVRLNTEMGKPLLSMLRATFSPMTARPIRPMSDCGVIIGGFLGFEKCSRLTDPYTPLNALNPPSMAMTWPVTNPDASSLSNHNNVPIRSSGFP